jgi:hypothetical protein
MRVVPRNTPPRAGTGIEIALVFAGFRTTVRCGIPGLRITRSDRKLIWDAGANVVRTTFVRTTADPRATNKPRALATHVQHSSVRRAVCAARSVPKELAAVKTPRSISLDRAMFAFDVAVGHVFALG